MMTKTRKIAVLIVASVLIALTGYCLSSKRVFTLDRSEEIAGGLTTGGWIVERDSLSVVVRGYFIIFKDGTAIGNNFTYGMVAPYAAIGEDTFSIALGDISDNLLAYSVDVSTEEDLIVLTKPIPYEPHLWKLYLRKVVSDTSTGDYSVELLGKWRIFGSDFFAIDNPIRDGDSGVIEFDRNGEVTFSMDRPPEISHGFEFPEVLSYAVLNDYILLETPTEDPLLYRIHSLGDLVVFERGEKVPWILVPVKE
jgi:hypothetical protein